MADEVFEHPRLASVYDAVDSDRSDLGPYLALVEEVAPRRVLDVGCGTGTFALLLAARGLDVTAVDPAAASLAVARAKPGAERVRWVLGTAASLPGPLGSGADPTDTAGGTSPVDLATMTGNVAQAIADPAQWRATLTALHRVLRPGGRLVLETRDPARRGWEEWTPEATALTTATADAGVVRTWHELVDVSLPLVTFRQTYVFEADGAVLTSTSTLRFRERGEIHQQLEDHGFAVEAVRDAPDRPGRELVFVARRG